MRKLAPVEMLLKQTAVGDDPSTAAPSVLAGAVVRLLVDKAYKLRQVNTSLCLAAGNVGSDVRQ